MNSNRSTSPRSQLGDVFQSLPEYVNLARNPAYAETLAVMQAGLARRRLWARFASLALGLLCVLPAPFAFGAASAPDPDPATAERLRQFLQRFPAADANGDGVLTESEARAFRQAKQPGKAAASAAARGPRAPVQANVAYGPHARNLLDCWRPEGDRPAPVLIFFHGGSFKAGDKSLVQLRPIFEECLAAGIACEIHHRGNPPAPDAEIAFLKRHLLRRTGTAPP
jgi:hypothetical protein